MAILRPGAEGSESSRTIGIENMNPQIVNRSRREPTGLPKFTEMVLRGK
jgi:hypothetical protein